MKKLPLIDYSVSTQGQFYSGVGLHNDDDDDEIGETAVPSALTSLHRYLSIPPLCQQDVFRTWPRKPSDICQDCQMVCEHTASGGVYAQHIACMHYAQINNIILKGMFIKKRMSMLNVIKEFDAGHFV